MANGASNSALPERVCALTRHQGNREGAAQMTVLLDEGGVNGQGARPKERSTPTRTKQTRDVRLGNYEEPWDRSNTQTILEEAFLAHKIQVSPSKESQVPSHSPVAPASQPHSEHTLGDARPQEGYEKPWDWKPHKKVRSKIN